MATPADGNGILVSDAVTPVESYVQLSDEEILADNPDLARFFEMIEDDEKYAKWEKEEMPLVLAEIKASANSGRTRQKKWARKAMVKSEIEACWVRSYWKKAAVSLYSIHFAHIVPCVFALTIFQTLCIVLGLVLSLY